MIRLSLFILYFLFAGLVLPQQASADPQGSLLRYQDFRYLLDPSRTTILLKYLHEPEHEEKNGPGSFDLHNFLVRYDRDIPISDHSYMISGFHYEARQYKFDTVPGEPTGSDSELFHRAELRLGAGHFIGDSFLLEAVGRGGVYSNLSGGLSQDDFKLHGRATAYYRINPGTAFLLGADYGKIFEDTDLIPIVGLRVISESGHLHLNLTVPLEATISYNINPQFTVYGGGWISGDEYSVEMGPNNLEFDVAVRDQRVGAGAQFWLSDNLMFGVEAGASVQSELEFRASSTSQFKDGELDTGPYASVYVGLALD